MPALHSIAPSILVSVSRTACATPDQSREHKNLRLNCLLTLNQLKKMLGIRAADPS